MTANIDREVAANELRDDDLEQVVGGDGPPSTAGDGNGRAMHGSIQKTAFDRVVL
jgi:hypothetical protein